MRLRTRAAGQRVGERAADPLEHRRAQQQVAYLRRLALQHLRQQVARDGALAAGELGDEALRIGVSGERDRGQPQAGGPPLGPLVEPRHGRVGERDPGSPRAARASPRARSAGRGRGSRSARPSSRSRCSPSARVLARGQHHAQRGRQPRQEELEPAAAPPRDCSSCRSSMTSTTGCSSERRSDSSRSTTAWPPKAGVAATRSTNPSRPPRRRAASMTDSQKRCASCSPRSTETHATRSASPSACDPRPQEHGLAASCRRAYDDHAARARSRQSLEQQRPLYEALRYRQMVQVAAVRWHGDSVALLASRGNLSRGGRGRVSAGSPRSALERGDRHGCERGASDRARDHVPG